VDRTASDRLNDVERLAAVAGLGLVAAPGSPEFDRLTDLTRRVLGVPVALVTLVHAERQVLVSCPGLRDPWRTAGETPISHSFCRHTIETGEPLVVNDANRHPILRANPAIEALGVVAYLGIPLITGDGHVLGTLCAIDHRPREWTEQEIGIMRGLAASVMTKLRARELTARVAGLERLQQWYDELQRNAGVGSWEWDLALDRVTWSDGAHRLFGLAEGQAPADYAAWLALIPEDARADVDAEVRRMAAGPGRIAFEHPVELPGGERRSILCEGRVVAGPAGQPARMVGSARDVTELRRAEAEARALETERVRRADAEAAWRRLTTVLERIGDAFVVVDSDWRYVYVNARAAELFGRDPSSLVGRPFWTELPEGVGEALHPACEQAMREQVPVTFEQHDPASDRWFENRVYPSPDGLSIFLTEVSDRRRAEEALRRSEERQKILLEQLPASLWTTDRDLRFTAIQGLGTVVSSRDVIGRSVEEIEAAGGGPPIATEAHRAALRGEPAHYQQRFGGRWYHSQIQPLLDAEGAAIGVIGVALDITERREAEQELAVLFGAMHDVILVLDSEGRYLRVAPTAAELLVRSPAELVGRTLHDVLPSEEAAELLEVIRAALETGEPRRVEYRMQIGEREMWFATTVSPLDEKRVLWVARDITERRALEEQLWHAQKLEITGRLAGGVAHDFNNLLTAIQGFASLLEPEFAAGDPGHECVVEIQRASERAAALTRHLLAFARKQVTRPETLDVNRHLAGTLSLLRRLVGPAVHLETELAAEVGDVHIDPMQLDQVLTNLVVNARDAMPGGGNLRIVTRDVVLDANDRRTHSFLAPGAYVLLEVSDDGTGMSPEVASQVFEPFFTTKERGKGTGLGLSTVYGIVKQNGGFVLVESAPSRGSRFRVYLPAVPRSREAAAVVAPRAAVVPGRGTVLVAEDEEGVRSLVRRVLEGAGYRVIEANDGDDAIRLFDEHLDEVQLVLSDVLMPGRDGRAVAAHVHTRAPAMPVAMMSGFNEPLDVEVGARQLPFLHKPFRPDELLHLVGSLLSAGSRRAPPA
jgi:two-component system, cell cycle sensor histidine kinase and response regulator CckA